MADECKTPSECPFDQIKMGKLFQKIEDMAKNIGEIKTVHAKDSGEIKKGIKLQNGRVRILEKGFWFLSGAILIIGFFITNKMIEW